MISGLPRQFADLLDVDGDGERLGAGDMGGLAVGALDVDLLLLDAGAEEAAGGAHEVAGVAAALEAHQVRAQQAVDDGPAPRQLGEDFRRGEGDVVEEPDLQVRARLAQHLGDQLELVVLHPDRGALVGVLDDGVGEPPVDLAVGVPPGPVELRRGDHVVVQRPQGGVGEALVEELDVVACSAGPGPGPCRRG